MEEGSGAGPLALPEAAGLQAPTGPSEWIGARATCDPAPEHTAGGGLTAARSTLPAHRSRPTAASRAAPPPLHFRVRLFPPLGHTTSTGEREVESKLDLVMLGCGYLHPQ
ncbi:hypothetical protein chiPu_0007343 [Chiloscyllium punctatum]|uniref:Uncharacterized protein n=1 Tax=Chiloscyllium punctatum TaxID=137246 RepID=A0A401SET5_CHIPU|nr:hypothetical protein [Chiloscyllium punctatum]